MKLIYYKGHTKNGKYNKNQDFIGKYQRDFTFSPKIWNHPTVSAVILGGAFCKKHSLEVEFLQKQFSVNVRVFDECKSNLPDRQPSIGDVLWPLIHHQLLHSQPKLTSNGRYGGGSGVCEYTFGPVTFECGPKASQKHALEPKATQKHAPGASRRLPKSTQGCLGPKMPPKWAQDGEAAVPGYPFTCKKL